MRKGEVRWYERPATDGGGYVAFGELELPGGDRKVAEGAGQTWESALEKVLRELGAVE